MSVTTASAKLLEPVLQLAQHYRLDQSQIFNSAALSHVDFLKPGARFPAACFSDVLQLLSQATNNPRIALSLGEATQPRILGSIGFLMSTAPTLGKAYQTLVDYLPLLFEGAVLRMEQSVEGTALTLDVNNPDLPLIEYFLACLVNWPRWLTGQQIPAHAVHLTFSEPDNMQPYQQFFAAEVLFNAPRNQVLLSSDYLALGCVDANAEMHQLHREFADSLLSKSDQKSALVAQTRNLIRQQLNEGGGAIRREDVAESAGLSLRTLQRKLGLLGTSFQDVYDQTRREVGLQLIQHGELSFGEIAFHLGFSNQSSFQKAFKRWMGVAPSFYRQQVKPAVFVETVALPVQKPQNRVWLEGGDIDEKIQRHLSTLNSVSIELLECASLLGDQFDLTELGSVTDNPVARVAIHLWPAEQAGFIELSVLASQDKHPTRTDEQTGYCFTHTAIRKALNDRMSDTKKLQLHVSIGQAMLNTLPQHFSLQQITPVLFHLNCGITPSNTEQLSYLQDLNMQAAALAQQQQDYHSANAFLEQAGRHIQDSHPCKIQLLLQRAKVLLLDGDIDGADQCLQQLPINSVSIEDTTNKALITAHIYQLRGLHAQSLEHLLDSLAALDQSLPQNESEQLTQLLLQITGINEQLSTALLTELHAITDSKLLLRLRLLEQISLIARQQSKPLLAACAIGRMTELSLHYGRSPLTAFAFVSYAWVASWFCADYTLAQTFSVQGMQLVTQPGQPEQADIGISAVLLQNSQVRHWFAPLSSVISQLQDVDQLATEQSQWLIQSDCRLLKHQLAFFSETPLAAQLLQCRDDHELMLEQSHPFQAACLHDSTLSLLEQLCEESILPVDIEYKHGWQAVSQIIGALLLDQQQHWPLMYQWEARLENEFSGYFCISEALFCTAMMRLIQAQQQHALGRRRRLETVQIESRMELWARHCPDNFKGQLLLIQAELACIDEWEAIPINSDSHVAAVLFEKAIEATQTSDFGYHQALAYERYSHYLQSKKQNILARLCLNNAIELYHQWGAIAKVKQLRQTLCLLAK